MLKWCLLFAWIWFTAFTANQKPPKTFIPWSAGQPVQWTDFRGKPMAGSSEAAMTASSIEFTYETNGADKLRWQVQSKFYPELSWSKANHRTPLILQHERLHFDITEIYARQMRKRFREEIKGHKDIPKFKAIAKAVMDDWNEEQQRYDEETKHSINHVKQAEWNQAVAERLQELEPYSAISFTIQK